MRSAAGKPVRVAAAALVAALAAAPCAAGEAPAADARPRTTLEWAESWGNVFGGREQVFHVRVEGTETARPVLLWRFAAGAATLARGEQAVAVAADKPGRAALRLTVPEPKEGVVLTCSLTATLGKEGARGEPAVIEKAVHVFPESPFAEKEAWLEDLEIRLFDPEKRTRAIFEKAGIPFQAFANVDAIEGEEEGLLVVGEGVSFRDYRALGRLLAGAAARGRRILVLAPGGGAFALPTPQRLALRGEDAIRELDKRLDDVAWPRDGKTRACGLKLVGARGPVNVEVTDGEGWPWLEMEYANGGRMVVCGFAVIRKWSGTPAPRFLLARVLEYVTRENEGGRTR
jgi:hypothetical protein